MKNQILLDNNYLTGELEERIAEFVNFYSHERYHESLNNVTLANMFYGRADGNLEQRQLIK